MASKRPHDLPGVIAAAGFIVLGVVLIRQTGRMTPLGSVFPITISTAMIVFSALLILRNVVIGLRPTPRATPEEETPETPAAAGSVPRRLAFLAAMAGWVVLMPVLGFFVTSLLGFFAIMAVATYDRLGLREGAILVAIGVAVITGFYLVMAEVLLIPIPRGVFF